MASSATSSGLLLLAVVIGVFAVAVTARPCKTIFFVTSSSSSSFYPSANNHLLNPNSRFVQDPPRLTFFITEIREFHRTTRSSSSLPRPFFIDRAVDSSSKPYYASSASVQTSIRDRTMDIMSIVGALLFGVGCGALTAATMYLIWSLFSPRRFDFGGDSDGEEYEDDAEDAAGPNKMGYVAIPTATKVVPPSADEVDAMK